MSDAPYSHVIGGKICIKRTIRIHTVVRFSVGRVTACKNRLSAPSKLSKIGYLCNSGIDFVACKGWKHIGVWERGGETGRLHFHGIFYIPQGGMVGEIVETTDYNTKDHRMQTAHQNTYFLERYGRNDFQPLGSPEEVQHSLGYLMKYIEKSGEKLIYGDLPTYFVSDVIDEDILTPYGIDDRKTILADDFLCMVDGEVMGKVSPEVIEKMPKAN